MQLRALRLRNFRNLTDVTITPHDRFNVLAGPNGQGKTNVLEAIYLLSAVKSFRAQKNATLIEWDKPHAVLEARVDRGGLDRIVRIEISERGKRVFLNNNPVRTLSDFFGTLNVVMFGPEDISLLKGGPGERRRFIDRAIFNAHPAFATESSSYDEVVKQRNALLKAPSVDRALLSVYDDQLITYGADIIARRLDFLRHFRPVLARTFRAIFDDSFEADLRYQVRWSDAAPERPTDAWPDKLDIEQALARRLETSYPEERDRGHTRVGPHRDDLVATINGHVVKTFASQGQHRAFVLAMKIAEITYLEERYHFAPILLLDDVSSELDRDRNRFLFDFLRARPEGQVFITTTHRDYILLDDELTVFDVASGVVTDTFSQAVEKPVEDPEQMMGALPESEDDVPFQDPAGFGALAQEEE